MKSPYTDTIHDESTKTRVFSRDVHSSEMVWHRDLKSREITILEGEGWMFQMDNSLPFELKVGDCFDVPAMVYHRIYKIGKSDLKIKIHE
jgi:mannose-6-phosphate isomerase-like protein (cupin superfamily)